MSVARNIGGTTESFREELPREGEGGPGAVGPAR